MDWTVYWFMLPVCTVVATVAMFSGISGAALLTPVFLIGFPLFNVPRLGTVAAIGTSLFLETSGFGAGLYRYLRLRLVDTRTARSIILYTLPLGALGAVAARHVPADALKLGYGVGMLGLAWFLLGGEPSPRTNAGSNPGRLPGAGTVPRGGDAAGAEPLRRNADGPAGPGAAEPGAPPCASTPVSGRPAVVSESDESHPACGRGEPREVRAASGHVYRYCVHGLRLQRALSGAGAFVAGMISTGVGEATLPLLVRRSKFPVPVAAATSTVVVAGTVAGAAGTHLVELVMEGGLGAIPWNLIVWAVPGAVAGAFLGTRLQGRVSETASRRFFAALFGAIGVVFLLAFTIFGRRFA